MESISIKIRYIYIRYLLIATSFIVLYAFFRWYFDYKLGIVPLKDDLLDLWFPSLFSLIAIFVGLRKRIYFLNLDLFDLYYFYIFIAGITIFAPTLIAQKYIKESTSNLQKIDSLSEITEARNNNYFIIEDFSVLKEYKGIYTSSRISGRTNDYLNFTMYIASPMIDNSEPYILNDFKYWCGVKFTKSINNHSGDNFKRKSWEEFYKDCIRQYDQLKFFKFEYLRGISYSDDKYGYIASIRTVQEANVSNLIILEPTDEELQAENRFKWIFGSFVIGAFVFLIMILIPSVNYTELKNYRDKKPSFNDDLKIILYAFIPTGNHFVTSLLMDINLVIFIVLVLSGINIVSATPQELLEVGASRRFEVMNGEPWRLFTSMFLHGGLLHIVGNLFGIGLACAFVESVLGRWRTILAYIISGLGSSLTSIFWHENTVSVGASGAILGMMGVAIVLSITKKVTKSIHLFLLGLFGGVSFLLGFLFGSIDNAGHIGGLLTGGIIGLILVIIDRKNKNPINL